MNPIHLSGVNPQALLCNALQWVDSLGPVGGLAFMGLYILATVAFLPGLVLTLGAGALFGVIGGSLFVLVGATLGSVVAFWVGRYLVRDWVAHQLEGKDRFKAIDQALAQEGWKIVLLTRLSPVFPFNLLNYAFGLSGVSLRDYLLGSVGMIPGTVMYVYLGSLAGTLACLSAAAVPTSSPVQWALYILGFLATLAVALYATRVARQALDKTVS